MSVVMHILEDLWKIQLRYKGVRVNMFGVPILWEEEKKRNPSSFYTTISRLSKNGFVEIKSKNWILTKKGREYFENKNKLHLRFYSPFPSNSPKKLLVMFDVPESKKRERDWLRWHLKEFQYIMVQKSVWVGPGPLPKKFADHMKNIGLTKNIKTFKLARPYQTKLH